MFTVTIVIVNAVPLLTIIEKQRHMEKNARLLKFGRTTECLV